MRFQQIVTPLIRVHPNYRVVQYDSNNTGDEDKGLELGITLHLCYKLYMLAIYGVAWCAQCIVIARQEVIAIILAKPR